MYNKLKILFLLAVLLAFCSIGASAQSMANSVKTFNVKFAPGKDQATVRGTALYAMSYVYNFRVKKGQTITVKAVSKEKDLTFSLFAPDPTTDDDELGFNVKEWSGVAPKTGVYSVTLVMNNEKAKTGVPYSILVKIQ